MKKKNIGIEDRIVFISNTLGSLVLSAVLLSSKSIFEMILGIYCFFNMFCYFIVMGKFYGGEK